MLETLFGRDHRLPLNRKEAFYSATVLPAIICTDEMAGFFGLLGRSDIVVRMDPETTNLQIFSEYDLRDAIRGDQLASKPWETIRKGMTGETPDLVILIDGPRPLLVVTEVKMFDKSSTLIAGQIDRQRDTMGRLKSVIPQIDTLHVAVVPASAAGKLNAIEGKAHDFTIVTWEQIAYAYQDVRPAAYWVRLLRFALSCEEHLRARRTKRKKPVETLLAPCWPKESVDDSQIVSAADTNPLDVVSDTAWKSTELLV